MQGNGVIIKKGLLLFCIIWGAALAWPMGRALLFYDLAGPAHWGLYTSSIRFDEKWLDERDDKGPRNVFFTRQPNDLAAQATMAEENPDAKQRIAAYDALLQLNPDNVWLIASRLRAAAGYYSSERLAGEVEKSFSRPPFPESTGKPPNLTVEEVEATLALARRGQSLEPDNTFFDWVLIHFLLGSYRDAEAFRAMHATTGKKKFDDHAYESIQASFKSHGRRATLLIEDKIWLMSRIDQHYWDMFRKVGNMTQWQAWKAERSGDYRTSLQLCNDLAHLGEPLLQRRLVWLGKSVQGRAWSNLHARKITTAAAAKYGSPTDMSSWVRCEADLFAAYANAHGAPEIARETHRLAQLGAGTQPPAFNWGYGIKEKTLIAIFDSWVLGLGFLFQLLMCALLAAALSIVLWLSRGEATGKSDINASSLLAAIAMTGTAAAICAYSFGKTWAAQLHNTLTTARTENSLALAGCFLVAPIVVSTWICWSVGTLRWWSAKRRQPRAEPQYEGLTAQYLPPDMKPMLIICAYSCYWIALLGCIVAAIAAGVSGTKAWFFPTSTGSPFSINEPTIVFTLLTLLLLGLGFLFWIAKWRWFTPPQWRPLTHSTLRWFRDTLLVCVLLASLAYLLCALGSIQARRIADRQLESYLLTMWTAGN